MENLQELQKENEKLHEELCQVVIFLDNLCQLMQRDILTKDKILEAIQEKVKKVDEIVKELD